MQNGIKIVVLDGYTTNPGDLSWEPLQDMGECTVYERSTADQVVERAQGAQILITNKTPITDSHLQQLESLQYIGLLSTGYDAVDVEAAAARDIPVTNVPDYSTDSVVQMVFAHILHFTQHAAHHSDSVKQGGWSSRTDFCYWDYPLMELSGLNMGIIGLGRIGVRVAELAHAFGMRVLAYHASPWARELGAAQMVDLETLLRESDVLSLHCRLNEHNRELINERRLSMMKDTALLINTARGALVRDDALADALNSGKLAGAGLDVMSSEPPAPDNPLLRAKNCLITPHIGWATRAARHRLLLIVANNLRCFLRGEPTNVVNMA